MECSINHHSKNKLSTLPCMGVNELMIMVMIAMAKTTSTTTLSTLTTMMTFGWWWWWWCWWWCWWWWWWWWWRRHWCRCCISFNMSNNYLCNMNISDVAINISEVRLSWLELYCNWAWFDVSKATISREWFFFSIYLIHKSQNAPVPYPAVLHPE